MRQTFQIFVLGVAVTFLFLLWMPAEWINFLRGGSSKVMYTIGTLLILFIMPALLEGVSAIFGCDSRYRSTQP